MISVKMFNRRNFIKDITLISVCPGIGLTSIPIISEKEEDVTPSEDLMREHGLLSRILLIFDSCRLHLVNNEGFDTTILRDSAQIVRNLHLSSPDIR